MKEELFRFESESYQNHFYFDSLPIEEIQSPSIDPLNPKSKLGIFTIKHTTDGKEDFIENYGNKLCNIVKTYITIVIEKSEEKISLKIFSGYRHRRVGASWFKVSKNVDFFTVNTKIGDVYHGHIHNYQKKKKNTKRIRKNFLLEEPVLIMLRKIKHANLSLTEFEAEDLGYKVLNIFMSQLDGLSDMVPMTLSDRLAKFHLDKKKIKYPNNFSVFIPFINKDFKKQLKKNENKIVDTLMLTKNLKGKKIKKAFHECSYLNLTLLTFTINFFGEDWINQDNVVLDVLNTHVIYLPINNDAKDYFSHEEKKRAYYIFKQAVVYKNISLYVFFDHVDLYVKLKQYGETELKWMSKDNLDYFHKEHIDWSDKLEFYIRGDYKRIYPEYFQKTLSEGINGYYPYLLTTSKDYNGESSVQSNCVKGYIGKVASMIISLRKGGFDSDERVTIEYRVEKEINGVIVDRVQTLGKFNQPVSDELNEILCILDQKVLSLIRDKRFETPKIEKKCANDKYYYSDSQFNEYGELFWTYNKINVNETLYNVRNFLT